MARTKDLFLMKLEWVDSGMYGCHHEKSIIVSSMAQAIEIASRVVTKDLDYTLTFKSIENKEVCYESSK